MSFNGGHIYTVGDFSLDTDERVLSLNGDPLPITPKMYDVLWLLVRNRGHLVEKEEILETVWSDSFVEEGNLAVTIRHLRKTLGDDAHSPRYIETVARRGYRLIANVSENPSSVTPPKLTPPTSSQRPYVLITIAAVLVISILGLSFVWFRAERLKPGSQTTSNLSNNGKVSIASISPDGHTLVFARRDGEGESLWKRDVWTGSESNLVSAAPVQFVGLTVTPASDFAYYSVFAENAVASNLARISLNGGTPESIPEINSDVTISFSPDGSRFAYTESHSAVKETHLKIANADGTQTRTLLTAKAEKRVLPVFRSNPVAWSPNGDIACAIQETDDSGVYHRIVLVNPNDGSERYLSDQRWDFIESIAWKDADVLAITNYDPNSAGRQIWLVSRANGDARRLRPTSKQYEWLSAAGGKLFAVERDAYSSLCIADFPEGLTTAQIKQISNEAGYIESVRWSGDKIYYNSWTSGKNEIWQINPDGTAPKQLTSNSNLTMSFTVSPIDGTLVFTATQKAADALFIADPDGRGARQLTQGPFDSNPEFTPDGKDVLFLHGSILAPTIWKVSIDETQTPKQVTGYRAQHATLSPDGKMIAYQFMDFVSGSRVWKLGIMDAENGRLLNTIAFPRLITNRNVAWRPGDNLITMIATEGESSGLVFLSPNDGSAKTIDNLTDEKIASLAWSRDGKRLVFSSNRVTSDAVMLDEN